MTLTFAMDAILQRNIPTGIQDVIFVSSASLGRKAIVSNQVQPVILVLLSTKLCPTSEHLVDVLWRNVANVGPVQQKFLRFGNLPQPLK